MHQARSIKADDFASDCPVSFALLASLMRSDGASVTELVANIPEVTRAQLAVYLYGRSHTHELGIRIAATCEATVLQRVAGLVGSVLHDLSRKAYEAPSSGSVRPSSRRISLGGPRIAA